MSFTNLLTISMPVYERKEFFREALESALNQTVKCKIIVVDNCSSHDYFKKVCKEKNVTYYRNDRNIGMSANFSKAFELSETKYAMNLQDDDRLDPKYVEAFVDAVTKYPDIDIFYCDFMRNTPKGLLPHQHTLPFGYMEKGNKIIEYGIRYKLGFPYIASAIKREKAHTAREVGQNIGSYDWEWLYSVANNMSFYGDSRPLYIFRDHDNQDTKINSAIYRLTLPYIYEKVLQEKVVDPKLKKKALKNAFWEFVYLKSYTNKKILKEIMNGDSKYHNYLKVRVDEDALLKTIYMLPHGLVNLTYRSMRKVGLAN
jgi:glycosyltransferase involved in cell wall biosynthesis